MVGQKEEGMSCRHRTDPRKKIMKFVLSRTCPVGGSGGMLPLIIYEIYYANICILSIPKDKKMRFLKKSMHAKI
jgi:hypothetical protein